MSELNVPEAARAADSRVALDPGTPPEVLAAIAEVRPELRAFVAMNPAAYPGLVQWLGRLGDPAVDAALAARASGAAPVAPPAPTTPVVPAALGAPAQPTAPAAPGAAGDLALVDRPVLAGGDVLLPAGPAAGPRPRRRWLPLVAVGGGVLILAGVGWFVVSALLGGGGASSPEGAVQSLADALDSEDTAAAMAALAPDEVQMLTELVSDVEDRATSLGFASEGATYAGVDLSVEDLQLDVDQLSDDVARVEISSGTVRLSLAPDQAAPRIGPVLRSADADGGSLSVDDLTFTGSDGQQTPAFLMVVRQDGGWYVSPLYTVGQVITESSGERTPSFSDQEWEPTVQDDPEAAVTSFIEAVGSLDPDQIADTVPAREAAAVTAYRRLLTNLPVNGEGGSSIEVDDLRTTSQDLGDGLTAVTVDSLDLTLTTATSQDTVHVDQSCVSDDWGDEWCAEDAFGSPDARLTFVAESTDGGWTVSPLNSLAQTMRSIVATADVDVVLANLDLPWLVEPTADLTVGGDAVEVTPGGAGVATATLTAPAGPVFVSGSGVTVYTQSGEVVPYPGYWNLPDDGTFVVVVYGDTATPVRVTAAAVETSSLAFDTPVSGHIGGADAGAAYTVDLGTDGIAVELDGPATWSLWSGDEYLCSGTADDRVSSCGGSQGGGTATLVLQPEDDQADGDYTLTLTTVAAMSVDGIGDQVQGQVTAYGTASHVIWSVPAYTTVDIVLTSLDYTDLMLDVTDPDTDIVTHIDYYFAGTPETYSYTNPNGYPVDVPVAVSVYGQSSDASYELSATESWYGD